MSAPFLYKARVGISALLLPFAARREVNRLRRAGFSVDRAHETLGHATARREGLGPLIWFHSSCHDEGLAVLWLIERMGHALPRAHFLLTSDTSTSARWVGDRLPPRTTHQFAPLDTSGPLKRFLRTWRPDAAVLVDTALSPQMLRRTFATGAPMALVNAKVTDKTIAYWKKRPALARYLLEVFALILAPNDKMAQIMADIHAPADRVARGIDLSALSAPLPADSATRAEVKAALKDRPVWVAASTHKGEEDAVIKAHQRLLTEHPDLCLIIAPDDIKRGTEVRDLIALAGLSYARRSRGEAPSGQVYLADTSGELGLWYGVTDVAFIGGSLRPLGGHNPFDAALSGAMALAGNHVSNFAETYSAMEAAGAARIVADADDLAAHVAALLKDDHLRTKARNGARDFVAAQSYMVDQTAERLIKALGL